MTDEPPPPRPPPPAHGPYGRPEWDAAAGEWKVRLTKEGQDFLTDWYTTHGTGVGLLRSVYPAAYEQAVMRGLKTEDMDGACRRALVRAMGTWDPARAKFATYLVVWLRAYVQQEATRQHRQAGRFAAVSGYERVRLRSGEVSELFDGVAADPLRYEEPSPADAMAAAESRADVRAALAGLAVPPAERRVVELIYGLGEGGPLSRRQVATELRLPLAAVNEIERRVLAALREAFADRDEEP